MLSTIWFSTANLHPYSAAERDEAQGNFETAEELLKVGADVQARPRLESARFSNFDCENDNSAFNLNLGLF